MRIAIDVSPLSSGHFLQHRVRGTGVYLKNLLESLEKYYPDNEYLNFKRGDKLPNAQVFHYPYFEPFFFTLPLGIDSKSIVTVHDLTPLVFKSNFPAGVKGNLRWSVQRRFLKKAGAIITDSENSKKDIIRIVGIDREKVYVVYLAASQNFNSSKKQLPKKFNLPEKFALYVGDATWNKNLPRLIEAFTSLDLPLAIAGKTFANKDFDHNNPWNQDLVKAQELASKSDKIRALGFVSDEDLAALYANATLFIMPSLYEGFGLPILEAMQSGTPVIASEKGSLKEVGGDAPLYVDPQSLDSIKGGVKSVWNDSELRKKMSERGLAQAKKFSWKKTAQETIKVYEEILES